MVILKIIEFIIIMSFMRKNGVRRHFISSGYITIGEPLPVACVGELCTDRTCTSTFLLEIFPPLLDMFPNFGSLIFEVLHVAACSNNNLYRYK